MSVLQDECDTNAFRTNAGWLNAFRLKDTGLFELFLLWFVLQNEFNPNAFRTNASWLNAFR